MRIIAGDIGGTKVLLRLVEDGVAVREERFESAAYKTFDDLLRAFLTEQKTIDSACFAVAGPVFEDRAEVTNTGWFMSASGLAEAFSIRRVLLINDFFAVALGVPLLAPGDLVSLNANMVHQQLLALHKLTQIKTQGSDVGRQLLWGFFEFHAHPWLGELNGAVDQEFHSQ